MTATRRAFLGCRPARRTATRSPGGSRCRRARPSPSARSPRTPRTSPWRASWRSSGTASRSAATRCTRWVMCCVVLCLCRVTCEELPRVVSLQGLTLRLSTAKVFSLKGWLTYMILEVGRGILLRYEVLYFLETFIIS